MPPVTIVGLLVESIARAYRKHIELVDQRRNWHDITVTLCLCLRVNRERRCPRRLCSNPARQQSRLCHFAVERSFASLGPYKREHSKVGETTIPAVREHMLNS